MGFKNEKEKDRTNYELIGQRVGHRDAIQELSCSGVTPGIFASASLDRRVKLWNDEINECIATYTGHTGAVNTVKLHSQVNLVHVLYCRAIADRFSSSYG